MKINSRLKEDFFKRNSDKVAKDLLGKIIVRKLSNGKKLKAKIVETEAYFDESDIASWARFGKRKDNKFMWDKPGIILIKNVHMHKMLNFVTAGFGKAGAVLIRALEPLNFEGRCSGPGLLTDCLKIGKEFNGKNLVNNKEMWVEKGGIVNKEEIGKSFRVGVKNDLDEKFRYYIKGSEFVSGVLTNK